MLGLMILLFLWSCKVSCLEQQLTHVVMPFPPAQVGETVENMNSWIAMPPCRVPRNVTLVFYISQNEPKGVGKHVLEHFSRLPAAIQSCFDDVRVSFEDKLRERDSYLFGSRIMFEQMLAGHIDYGKDPHYVMYMEPDCRPIQPFWLDAVIEQVEMVPDKFWMKGSVFRGDRRMLSRNPPYYVQIHINGNAIYNIGDKEFFRFYNNQVKPFIAKNDKEGAYDIDIFKYLLWGQGQFAANYLHLFHFSNFIQNHWHSPYSMQKVLEESRHETFLVHGGHPV